MEKISKGLFKEIMVFVKQFEALGNKWCEEEDLASIAQARSYGKKIISAMKPFIESSIRETEAAIAEEKSKLDAVVVPEPIVEVVEPPVETKVEEVVVNVEVPVVEEVVVPIVEEVKVEVEVAPEIKIDKDKNKSPFNFNKRK